MLSSNSIHKQRQRIVDSRTEQSSDDNHKLAHDHDPSQPASQSSAYVPVQFSQEDEEQDPTVFYGRWASFPLIVLVKSEKDNTSVPSLINQAGYPSEVLCRMSDGLFFYVNHNCPQSRGTQLIEPEKIFWENVALGHDADVSEVVARQVSSLYDNAGIPYTLNSAGAPVLDRRGYIRFRLFEIRANPEECHQYWNKILKVFKLRDPVTNLPFPTPIPRLAFPAHPDHERRNIFVNWQTKAVADLMRKRALKAEAEPDSEASPSNPSSSGKPTEKQSKFSKWMRIGGKDDKDKGKEEPEAVQRAAHEKKKAAIISVGASVVSNLIGQFA